MATRNIDVGAAPTNIVSALSLTVGTTYTLENVDPSARVFLRSAAVTPTGGALRGHVLNPGELGYPTPRAGIGIWVWCAEQDAPVKCVITESG